MFLIFSVPNGNVLHLSNIVSCFLWRVVKLVNNELQLRIFRNQNYYNGKGDAYLIYCNGGGLFLNTKSRTRKLLTKPDSSVDAHSVMDYARSKGFVHIIDAVYNESQYKLDIVGNTNLYNKNAIIGRFTEMLHYISNISMNDNDKEIAALYSRIKLLLKNIK